MWWSLRFALAGAVLFAAAFGLPFVFPPDEDYGKFEAKVSPFRAVFYP